MFQEQVEFWKGNTRISGMSAEAPNTHRELTGLHSVLLHPPGSSEASRTYWTFCEESSGGGGVSGRGWIFFF